MGQAKRRGTREQRVAIATAAAQQTAAEAHRLEYQSITPQQRSQRLRLALLLAVATSAL